MKEYFLHSRNLKSGRNEVDMECTGKVKEISRGIDTNNFLVTLEVSDITLHELKAVSEHEKISVVLKTWRKKRSLDANAYYWVLIEKIAKLNKTSKNVVHNIMLERYGTLERMEGGQLIPVCIRDNICLLYTSRCV